MTVTETIAAFERSLITEDEAIEQAMADDLNDLYKRAVLELAPHLAADVRQLGQRPC